MAPGLCVVTCNLAQDRRRSEYTRGKVERHRAMRAGIEPDDIGHHPWNLPATMPTSPHPGCDGMFGARWSRNGVGHRTWGMGSGEWGQVFHQWGMGSGLSSEHFIWGMGSGLSSEHFICKVPAHPCCCAVYCVPSPSSDVRQSDRSVISRLIQSPQPRRRRAGWCRENRATMKDLPLSVLSVQR